MAAVERELIRPQDRLALLFTPPFDKTPLDPGYIKGYPPGIRENGGQYTHAALWSVMAFAALGEGDKAARAVLPSQPHQSRPHAGRCASLQGGTLCRRRRRLCQIRRHVGRGGWTWYTGSAGWMQRAGIESILGLRLQGDVLHLDPCIPKAWPSFEMTLRYRSARYEILVENPGGAGRGIASVQLDDTVIVERPLRVPLAGRRHHTSFAGSAGVIGARDPTSVRGNAQLGVGH